MTNLVPAAMAAFLALAAPTPFDPFQEAGIDHVTDAHVDLDAAMVDETGTATTLRAMGQGKPVVLVPVLHNCPNICGATLGGIAQAIRAQAYRPGADFVVVAFGIDPAERPEDANRSLQAVRAADPDMSLAGLHATTADGSTLAAVLAPLGYRYAWDARIGQYAHIAAAAVLTADGHLSRWLYGVAPDPVDLKLALTEAGQGRVGGWTDQLLLLCYHYDPATGRYGSIVTGLLQLAGGLTILIGVALIARSLLRERRAARGGTA